MILNGRTILLTGGSNGIGRALAERFAELGNTVIALGRDEARLAEVSSLSPRIHARRCDLEDAAQRVELAEWVVKEHPDFDVLYNNAAVQYRFDVTQPIDLVKAQQQLEINLLAPLHLASLLVDHLATRPKAAIVNTTSALAFTPLVEIGVYSATKAALHSLSISMRYQLRERGIDVIELLPPKVDTTIGAELRDDPDSTQGGMPVPELVRQAVAGLAGDDQEILIGLAVQAKADPEAIFRRLNDDNSH
ncbi:MAG: SDR family NAD(P)-dependent oxidoreductase [Hamadaea sp.]|uniref:SDR family oxidoreductase n=1 Tax=Hamadaea sp. TaxID=2024425 RepID=UPI0017DAEAD0|nr:SDR family NAD(P)-dependent oxidoreductase [Hamadaea sp.]NUR71647.1 SDR family NAD(P)-dependent oxidoreductase [Hamadaea sp.]NUT20211.1 SDR family NAD(P)-dependent oxidoreductase [Hamadaea sp.]